MEKKCFKCGITKDINDFYKHPQMSDGRFGKCKECAKGDASKYSRTESGRGVERSRNRRRNKYLSDATRLHRQRNPLKYRARNAVNNAIRDGKLVRMPCRICGEKAQAHHEDYSKPLEVDWLCFKHHREIAHNQTTGITEP